MILLGSLTSSSLYIFVLLSEALTSALAPETTSQSTTTGTATAAATTTLAPTSGLSDTSTTTHHIAESSTHHIAESSTHHSAESSTIQSAELSTRQSTTGSPNTLNYIYIGAGAFVALVVLFAVVIVLVCRYVLIGDTILCRLTTLVNFASIGSIIKHPYPRTNARAHTHV